MYVAGLTCQKRPHPRSPPLAQQQMLRRTLATHLANRMTCLVSPNSLSYHTYITTRCPSRAAPSDLFVTPLPPQQRSTSSTARRPPCVPPGCDSDAWRTWHEPEEVASGRRRGSVRVTLPVDGPVAGAVPDPGVVGGQHGAALQPGVVDERLRLAPRDGVAADRADEVERPARGIDVVGGDRDIAGRGAAGARPPYVP